LWPEHASVKIIIDNQVRELADHSSQPGRILVTTLVACKLGSGRAGSHEHQSLLKMVRERIQQVPEVLLFDGPRTLMRKAAHMMRRESLRFDRQAASIAGRVRTDLSTNGLAADRAVAAVSLTHPTLCDSVVARPELVWPLSTGIPSEVAALVLPGMVVVAAADAALKSGSQRIGVQGEGVLAALTLAWLAVQNNAPQLVGSAKLVHALGLEARVATDGLDTDDTLVVTDQTETRNDMSIALAIGVDLSADLVRELWPGAARITSCDLTAMLREFENSYMFDVYYEDGPLTYAEWFTPGLGARFVAALPSLAPTILSWLNQRSTVKMLGNGIQEHTVDGRVKLFDFRGMSGELNDSGLKPTLHRRTPAPGTRLIRPKKPRSIGLGLIGGGRWPIGMVVRQLSLDGRFDLRGICDRRPEAAYLGAQALNFAFMTTAVDELLDDPDIDLIVVAPYHGAHAPLAARVLRAGKHCFVEKPPAINRAQLDDLACAARIHGKILYVGYNRRFAPINDRIWRHQLTRQGPKYFDFAMRAIDIPRHHWYYWPSNGNRIISNCCHLIDYACYLAGPELPLSVTTTSAVGERTDENVIVNVCFSAGTIASLSYFKRGKVLGGYYQRYTIAQDDLFCEIDGFERFHAHARSRTLERWRGVRDMGHRRQMARLADAIATGGPSPVSLLETLVSARTLLAAAESAERGGVPINVDLSGVASNYDAKAVA
jgi:predicted dehydrogenase